jgi:hypothetical protein
VTSGTGGRDVRDGLDQSYGWAGPVGEMLKEAVISGAYRTVIRRDPNRAQAFEALAQKHSARVDALATGIGEAGALLVVAGLADHTPA